MTAAGDGVGAKTVKHTTIYALGVVAGRAASIVMLPIYLNHLTPEDYGVLELLGMTLDFVSVILGLRIGQAVFRYHAEYKDRSDKNELMSTAMWMVVALNVVGVSLLLALSKPSSWFVFGNTEHVGQLMLFAPTLLLTAVIEVVFVFIRAEQKPWVFVGCSLTRLLLQVALNIYFVVVKGMHVEGVIYGAVLSNGFMCVMMCSYSVSKTGIRWSTEQARTLISFSWPLLLAGIGAFYLTFGDRYFLRLFAGTDEVGLYSLAYRVAFALVILFWRPFISIWESQRYEVYKRKDAVRVYQRTFVMVSLILITASLGVTLFIEDLLVVIGDAEYYPAAPMVPVLLAAYVLQSWTSFCNLGIMVKNNTIQITYATVVAIVVISAGYGILVPMFGGMGAAWATLIAFAARLIWVYKKAKAHFDMCLPWATIRQISAMAIAVFLATHWAPDQLFYSIAIHSVAFGAFLALLVGLPILGEEERKLLKSLLRRPWAIRKALS